MSNEDNKQTSPRQLTRFERALLSKGLYFPPELNAEILDALKAIAVEEGYKDSKGLDIFEIRFESEKKGDDTRFRINLFGYGNKPGAFKLIVDQVKTYAREHGENIGFEQADDQRIIIHGPDFRILVDSIVEGFINKYSKEKSMPDIRVDTDAIMNAPRKWVDIAQAHDGEKDQGFGHGK